ncbi:MAG: tetratricopeptide repeat protein [Pyrinomonadaceae bacterium]
MKRCPSCQLTYTDETLKFCREDGSALITLMPSLDDLPATLVFNKTWTNQFTTEPLPLTTAQLSAPQDANARRRASRKAIDSLAILPLVNSSADPNMEYMSDGITESIINNLSQLPKLRVMARSTVFRYKGRDADPLEVGNELRVRAVLTGRVNQLSDQLMISAELVDVLDGTQLWGEQYNRKFSDIFEVQEDIAREISGKLRFRLTNKEKEQLTKRYTDNTDAYQCYLKGRYSWNKRTEAGFERAIHHFNGAIKEDFNYALAYTGLADSYVLLSVYGVLAPDAAFTKARAAAIKALELDDSIAEAHTSLAHIKESYEWNFSGAERKFQRAIDLNPNYAVAHHWYAHHLMAMGRFEESLKEIKKARELDPLSLSINVSVGLAFYWARKYEQALEHFFKTVEIDSSFPLVHVLLGQTYEQIGMYKEAAAELDKAKALDDTPQVSAIRARIYALSGQQDEAERLLEELNQTANLKYVSAYFRALIYEGLGNRDEAFRWLNHAYDERSGWMVWLKVEPKLDSLRSDPRFEELLRRVGLVADEKQE